MSQNSGLQATVFDFVADIAWKCGVYVNPLPVMDENVIMLFQPTEAVDHKGPDEALVRKFAETLNNNKKWHTKLTSLTIEVVEEKGPQLSFGEDITENMIYKIMIS